MRSACIVDLPHRSRSPGYSRALRVSREELPSSAEGDFEGGLLDGAALARPGGWCCEPDRNASAALLKRRWVHAVRDARAACVLVPREDRAIAKSAQIDSKVCPESNLDAGAIRAAVDVRLFKSGGAPATPLGVPSIRGSRANDANDAVRPAPGRVQV